MKYSLSDFHYELPDELIAIYPHKDRTASRLLCLNKHREIQHKTFQSILDLTHAGDLLVLNDTRVIPARLYAKKETGGAVEILIERSLDDKHILAHLKTNKSLKLGTILYLENGVRLEIIDRMSELFKLRFVNKLDSLLELLDTIGHMPLPPYMRRKTEEIDQLRYQTVFAKQPGAIAAPTAGLHFDQNLIDALLNKGVNISYITLHVGAATFKPVKTNKLEEHVMHTERVIVSEKVVEEIKRAKKQKKRVIAVGTTTVRSLETAALTGHIKPFDGESNLFIYPGFSFQCVDAVITNFHLPKSSLLMLVSALVGLEQIKKVYSTAIKESYRFFSYGDACWLER